MLCYSGCAVPQELGYHLQAYTSVQAPGSIGVSSNVGKDRFINPTQVPDGIEIDVEFMISNDREFEVILFENLYTLLQDDSGIERSACRVCNIDRPLLSGSLWSVSSDKVQFPAALVLEIPHFHGQSTVSCGSRP